MKIFDHAQSLSRRLSCLLLVLGLSATGAVQAANHALILWIGDYGRPAANLPGVDIDARSARQIAALLNVPAQNIRELANAALTRQSLVAELASLQQRMADGDRVFIYFSGHGYQMAGERGAACTEALVLRDAAPSLEPDFFKDFEFEDTLSRIAGRASQVVVMNDSCFSGGAVTRGVATKSFGSAVPKLLPAGIGSSRPAPEGYQCGQAVNKMTRSMSGIEQSGRGPQVLYIAASSDIEVAYATPSGSVATNAWLHCLSDRNTDTDRSGIISGRELQVCAQRYATERGPRPQTITLSGNAELPLVAVVSNTTAPSLAAEPVDAARALADLRQAASRDYRVTLETSTPSLRIGVDRLDFSVTTNLSGYLYILQVGSDGKTFNALFPNEYDKDNRVAAGRHVFPRPDWRVRAGGPAGNSYLLAIVSPQPRDFTRGMASGGGFASAPAVTAATRTLFVEATGSSGRSGSYGASNVLAIRETP